MPANTREIDDRIQSVKKTKKITLAMKMVSAAKFKRCLSQLTSINNYGESLDKIKKSIEKRLNDSQLPTLLLKNDSPQTAIIVVSSDRGLCGGFNTNLFKAVEDKLAQLHQVDLYLVGNKAHQYFKNKNVTITDSRPSFNDTNGTSADITDYIDALCQAYCQGVYSTVFVMYNEYVSALVSNQKAVQLLPVELPNWTPKKTSQSDFIYESSKPAVLGAFLSKYIQFVYRRALCNSRAAEEGSRMAAMDSASSNANDMIDELTLFYNRSRQSAITTELTEIVAGAASLS